MNANIANLEKQRLREEQPRPEMTDDETLEHVRLLMNRIPRYREAMNELIDELLIGKGETIAINLGIEFPLED